MMNGTPRLQPPRDGWDKLVQSGFGPDRKNTAHRGDHSLAAVNRAADVGCPPGNPVERNFSLEPVPQSRWCQKICGQSDRGGEQSWALCIVHRMAERDIGQR